MNPCTIRGKQVTLQRNYDRNSEGHMAVVDRGDSGPHFSPEELAVMKANWERDHGSERIPCRRNPQGIMPKACKNWQFVYKRIYVSGLYNPLYCICRGAPRGEPCERWLTDEDYLKEFIIRQRQRRQQRNALPRP